MFYELKQRNSPVSFLLNDDIERREIGLKTAEKIIEQGNAKLQDALRSKILDKNALLYLLRQKLVLALTKSVSATKNWLLLN